MGSDKQSESHRLNICTTYINQHQSQNFHNSHSCMRLAHGVRLFVDSTIRDFLQGERSSHVQVLLSNGCEHLVGSTKHKQGSKRRELVFLREVVVSWSRVQKDYLIIKSSLFIDLQVALRRFHNSHNRGRIIFCT